MKAGCLWVLLTDKTPPPPPGSHLAQGLEVDDGRCTCGKPRVEGRRPGLGLGEASESAARFFFFSFFVLPEAKH